mgnify:CR=1 FL=1
MILDDRELIECAQHGDREAMAALYDRYHPLVYNFIFYRVGDQQTAEDLTAEVFMRMIARLPTFVIQGHPLLAWLYTIARNLVTDHYRNNNQGASMAIEEDLIAGEIGQPAALTDARLAQECLQRALRYLTEEQRQMVVLKYIEDREIVDVAIIMERNERAVRSIQHRALAALHRAIEKERCYEP